MSIIHRGAEAILILEDFNNALYPSDRGKILIKHRIPKKYRVTELDENLRESRTILEAKLLADAKRAGVPTPIVYDVDLIEMKIIMEYVEGEMVKTFLEDIESDDMQKFCCLIGEQIGKLHKFGIIHGDLTTSNMIRSPYDKIYFIDFGLGEYDLSTEARGTDLNLLFRTLQSTHHKISGKAFDSVIKGYKSVFNEFADEIIQRIEDIRRRGRYIAKEER